jgi:hypothetical protein
MKIDRVSAPDFCDKTHRFKEPDGSVEDLLSGEDFDLLLLQV